jgi:acetoin utilization deacetylase AcuC-like enzyme
MSASIRADPAAAIREYRISIAVPVYLSHPSSLEHDTGHHPEQPARITAIEQELEARGWLGCERALASAATREQLEAVHTERHVAAIVALSGAGGGAIDFDTFASAGSWDAALHAAGAACELVDRLLGGANPSGFAAMRPPGHHADAERAMGFCLFNNVAVAARHALAAHDLTRVMVLDWDVHHGNGTNDIFNSSAEVLFVSIHESPLYPGTGPATDCGTGEGAGHTVNLPVPEGSGDEVFVSLVEHVAVPLARRAAPQLLLVSAGYDAHEGDPLAGCRVTDEGYAQMTALMRALAGELDVPLGIVLERGYALGPLARSVAETITVLAGSAAPPPRVDPHPLALQARHRLGLAPP